MERRGTSLKLKQVEVRDWPILPRTDTSFANLIPFQPFSSSTFSKRKRERGRERGEGERLQPLFSRAAMALSIVEQCKGQVSRPRSTLMHRLHHSSPPPFPCLIPSSCPTRGRMQSRRKADELSKESTGTNRWIMDACLVTVLVDTR